MDGELLQAETIVLSRVRQKASEGHRPFAAGEFGTYYRFLQKDVLRQLSPRLQNYFSFMFKQGDADRAHQSEADALRPSWLRTLEGPRDRFIFHVHDKVGYPGAMTTALGELLGSLR